MRYSKEFIEAVKNNTNLLDLISEYASDIRKVSSTVWSCRCPHPEHNDSTASFRIWFENNRWSWACMGCHSGKKDTAHKNYGSDAIAFLQWISSVPGKKQIGFAEAVEILAKRSHMELKNNQLAFQYKILKARANGYHANLTNKAKEYLYARGLNDDDINEWNIGYTVNKEQDVLVERITIPLVNHNNVIIGFTNRDLNNISNAKYINSKNDEVFNKASFFFGANKLDRNCNEIKITEGAMDVILASKYNVKNMVGLLGTALTEEKIDIIAKLNMTPILCLDNDVAGQKATKKSLMLLAEKEIYAKVFIIPSGKDIADLANELQEDLDEYISSHAKPFWQYQLEESVTIYDTLITEAKNKVLQNVLDTFKSAQTEQEKAIMKSFVLERMGIVI